jgi:hypothetical protein
MNSLLLVVALIAAPPPALEKNFELRIHVDGVAGDRIQTFVVQPDGQCAEWHTLASRQIRHHSWNAPGLPTDLVTLLPVFDKLPDTYGKPQDINPQKIVLKYGDKEKVLHGVRLLGNTPVPSKQLKKQMPADRASAKVWQDYIDILAAIEKHAN